MNRLQEAVDISGPVISEQPIADALQHGLWFWALLLNVPLLLYNPQYDLVLQRIDQKANSYVLVPSESPDACRKQLKREEIWGWEGREGRLGVMAAGA